MIIDLQMVVFGAGFILLALVFLLVVLSIRADQAVTIKGPMATQEELEARIEAKRGDLLDLDEDLKQRREALANVADIGAEVDALERQKAEILTELAQMDDRRQEVLTMRQETDEAYGKLADITRDLAEKSIELEGIQAKLDHAERLKAEIQAMTDEHAALETNVAALHEELASLQVAQAREDELRRQVEKLERNIARLQGDMESYERQNDEAQLRAQASQERLAGIEAEHIDAASRLEGAETEVRQSQSQLSRLENQRAELEARLTHLKSETDKHSGAEGEDADRMSTMKALPPVLEDLKKREEWDPGKVETEADALRHVQAHLKTIGLQYHRRVVYAFHTAMKVNETTQMAVLAGISGTGKSQLPRQYSQAMGIGFLQVPVQPRWDSPQDLMGFYNYIEGKFRPTEMARALYHMDRFNGPPESAEFHDRMIMVLLDEMNLARVEYYFSDFLSRLESRPSSNDLDNVSMRKDSEIELDIPTKETETAPRIFPGYNVLFAGTMNEDESTQSLSDKVVDRANMLRFAAPRSIGAGLESSAPVTPMALSRKRWNGWIRKVSDLGGEKTRVESHVAKMVELMHELQRPIGYRLGLAIMSYVANYPAVDGGDNILAALADQVEMRLLPKLRGIDLDSSDAQLQDLVAFIEHDLNDSVLAKALAESVDFAANGTGQFVWRGVTR